MRQTEEKVFSYLEEHHMLKPQDIVVAGVSGGADSVCLLFLLLEYAKRVPITPVVVHVDHGIRREAAEDAAFVERLCREQGVAFCLRREDVPGKAAVWGISEEEAGRRVRYEAFAQAAGQLGEESGRPVKIAVAHHAGDRAETFLFHLFRGSGIKGLGSIRPVRDDVIRPLLCLERREIEAYLKAGDRTFCQDSTNEKDDYTRNRIRHHILPYAEEHISQGAVRHICGSAQLLAETEDYLEQQTLLAEKSCMRERGEEIVLRREDFAALHPVLQKRVLLSALQRFSPARKDISAVHVELVQGLLEGESGRSLDLPFGVLARREYGEIVLTGKREPEPVLGPELAVDLSKLADAGLRVDYQGTVFLFRRYEREKILKKNENIPQNKYTKWFDYDKIKESLMVRTRQPGDYLTIRGREGGVCRKSLKDYMITEKIPRRERTALPLLAEGSHVLWLTGYRISEAVKISEDTKHILQVQLIKEQETEDEDDGTHQGNVIGGGG